MDLMFTLIEQTTSECRCISSSAKRTGASRTPYVRRGRADSALFAVYQDATGVATEEALSYADGIGERELVY